MSDDSDFAPEHYFCALTGKLMEHPFQHKVTGVSYERKAVLEFIYFGNGSVLNLHPSQFVDNPELEEEIKKWKESNDIDPEAPEDDEDDDDKVDKHYRRAIKNAMKIHDQALSAAELPPKLSSISEKVLSAQQMRIRANLDAQKMEQGRLAPLGPNETSSSQITKDD